MKKCGRCKEDKELSEFSKDKRAKDGLRWECKTCWQQYYVKNKQKLSEYHAQYQREHYDRVSEIKKKYYNKIKVSKQPDDFIL